MTLTRRVPMCIAAVGLAFALAWGASPITQEPEAPGTDASGWIREDIEAGYAAALASGKPLLVAFR